jgi:hypothetical protein
MAKPLAERMNAALAPNARASDVSQLIQIITDELAAAEADVIRFHAIAIAIGSTDEVADEAADAENRTARRGTRLRGQQEQMQARLAEIVDADDRREGAAKAAAVRAERDQLAADLAAEWPLLEARMRHFFWRIVLSDKKMGPSNMSAEAIARGRSGAFSVGGTPIHRLTQIALPSFNASDFTPAWPPHHLEFDWALIDMDTGNRILAECAEKVSSLQAAPAEQV